MKPKILKTLVISMIASFVLFYFIFAFSNYTLDPSKWVLGARAGYCTLSLIISGMITLITTSEQ